MNIPLRILLPAIARESVAVFALLGGVTVGILGTGLALTTPACTPGTTPQAVEAGVIQLASDTCALLDPDGGLNPVVDVICSTLDGRKVQLRMRRQEWHAMRAAAPRAADAGGGF